MSTSQDLPSRRDFVSTTFKLGAGVFFAQSLIFDADAAHAFAGPGESVNDYLQQKHGVKLAGMDAAKKKFWRQYFSVETYTGLGNQNPRLLHTLWGHDSLAPKLETRDLAVGATVTVAITAGSGLGVESELARTSANVAADAASLSLGKATEAGTFYVRLYARNGAVLHGFVTIVDAGAGALRADLKLVGDVPIDAPAFAPVPVKPDDRRIADVYLDALKKNWGDKAKTMVVPWMAQNVVKLGKMGVVCVVFPVALNTVMPVGGAARGIGYCVVENAALGIDFFKSVLTAVADDLLAAGKLKPGEAKLIKDLIEGIEFIVQYGLSEFQDKLVALPQVGPNAEAEKLKRACALADAILKAMDYQGGAMLKLNENQQRVFDIGIDAAGKFQALWCNKGILAPAAEPVLIIQ